MNINQEFVSQLFIQLLTVIGLLGGIIAGIITWIGKKSLDKLDLVIDKTNVHAVTLEVHSTRLETVEKRQDDFDEDQRRQDDQIYLVTYPKKK